MSEPNDYLLSYKYLREFILNKEYENIYKNQYVFLKYFKYICKNIGAIELFWKTINKLIYIRFLRF